MHRSHHQQALHIQLPLISIHLRHCLIVRSLPRPPLAQATPGTALTQSRQLHQRPLTTSSTSSMPRRAASDAMAIINSRVIHANINGPSAKAGRSRKASTAAQVDIAPEQYIGLKQEGENGHVGGSAPNVVVKTEGLAAAAALNGMAEQPRRRGKRAPVATTLSTEPDGSRKAPANGASLAAALRAAVAAQGVPGVADGDAAPQAAVKREQGAAGSMPAIPTPGIAEKGRRRKVKGKAAAASTADAEEGAEAAAPAAAPRRSRAVKKAASAKETVTAEDAVGTKGRKTRAPQAAKAAAQAAQDVKEEAAAAEQTGRPKRARRAKTAPAELAAEEIGVGIAAEDVAVPVEEEEAPKKKRRGRGPDPDAYVVPGREILDAALASPPGPRPVPNLGYACLNMDLREQRPPIFTNRDCIQKTFLEKGLDYISALALENSKALAGIIQWNHEHGIRFFRLTSNLFPWCTEYELGQLPDYAAIADELAFAGKLARAYDQRLTFHPSHFVKLGAEDGSELLKRSMKELEVHSQVFDLMGYLPPSHENKINIHIGGVYGDKPSTLARFASNFRRLSAGCRARLTIENDDIANSYSITDLLPLSKETGIPLVFDFHHQKFCPGGLTEKEAVYAAIATWPPGVRPVVHWSESQEGRKPHAHSDFIDGPMELHGLADKVDVMIEAKCKERALIRFRNSMKEGPSADAQMALKFL